jgi:hypothetical protein
MRPFSISRARVGATLHGVVSEDEDPPVRRAHEARDGADQRRLAGAVGAEQADEAAARDAQLELVERARPVGVGLAQPLDEQRRACAIDARSCRHVGVEATLAAR